MFGTIVSFCLMAIGARELSQQLDTFQILFFRTIIALTIISVVILATKKRSLLRTKRLKLHFGRNLFPVSYTHL
ncbi:EamA family transporter, partial [Vibrio europaeus]|nr:EamA family transporter [Vibrio europaeus]